jgi:hypothetical protein
MLANLINQHALDAAKSGDWSAVATTLNAQTIVVRDSTPISYATLGADLGDDVRALVAKTLRTIASSQNPLAGEVADAHVVLLNEAVGLRIDSDTRQQTIDLLAAAGRWPDSVRDAIKARGKRMTSLAGGTVTADECRVAWTTDTMQSQWASLQNESINAAVSSGDREALADALAAASAAVRVW